MLPRTAFAQFIPPRLDKARRRLSDMIWTVDPTPLAVTQSPPTRDATPVQDADTLKYRPAKRTPSYWGRAFEHCWWTVQVPSTGRSTRGEKSQPRYLRWCDQGEATVFIDGIAWAGVDPGHTHVALPSKLDARGGTLRIESVCCRTGIWVPGAGQGIDERGSRFDGAFLASRDDDAWHAFHDVDVLLEVAVLLHGQAYPLTSDWPKGFGFRRPIEGLPPVCRKILDGLDRAVDALDNVGPAAMRKITKRLFADLPADATALDATLTGHAHIDLVWLWPERIGEFKATHSFANVLDVQRRYPEMTFGYSQPASYEAVGRRNPELLRRVKRAAKAGAWEPTGALYVESDTQLPCGEALVRAFSLGQQGFRDLRGDGSEASVVWIPDVFGYSGVMPTLMNGFGVPYFFTTKMHWSSANQFPYSSFKWVGHDGSQVLAHLAWEHYNLAATPPELDRAQNNHRQSAVHPEALVPTGYGDGGGGPNDAMCERARRLANVATMPRCKWGTIEIFFDRMAEPKVRDELPTWDGEMYLEYHRGVQTTHGDLKEAFRAAERGLQQWEAARCVLGLDDRDAALTHAWKRVVFAQFHDDIPGSSIPQVYEEAVPELQQIAEETHAEARETLEKQSKHKSNPKPQPCVFNPLPVSRTMLHNGQRVELPSLSGTAVADLNVLDSQPVKASTTTLDNGRVKVNFNAKGEIRAMRVDGQPIQLTQPAAQLWTFPDHPANYDAWDLDRSTLTNGTRVTTPAQKQLDPAEPLAPSLAFTRNVGRHSTATVRYTLEAGSAVLRITIELDWQDPQALLKFVMPTDYRGKYARYGAPFGSVQRPQLAGPLANDAMFEVPGSRWACVSDDTESQGAMLITQAKYGFGAYRGTLHLSLVRSAVMPGSTYGGGGNHSAASSDRVTDLQHHTIELALGAFAADAPRDQQPAALADTLFTEPWTYHGVPCDAGLLAVDPVNGGDSLIPAFAVPARKGTDPQGAWTLRLHETLGRRGTARLRLAPGRIATPTDLRGHDIGPPLSANGHFDFTPYAVMSFRIHSA
ncbi:MAG: glycoside hydrolase family 38 C-terminal domain-containing protein [Planctomycetota bacterium]